MQRRSDHNSLQATQRHQLALTARLVSERTDARDDAPEPGLQALRDVVPQVGEAPHGGSRGFVDGPAGAGPSRRVYVASEGYALPVFHAPKVTEDVQ